MINSQRLTKIIKINQYKTLTEKKKRSSYTVEEELI